MRRACACATISLPASACREGGREGKSRAVGVTMDGRTPPCKRCQGRPPPRDRGEASI